MSCWYEPDDDGPMRLAIGQVRPLLTPGQSSITLESPAAVDLPVQWLWRTGGTFGSRSSAAANDRQRVPRSRRGEPMPTLDRGSSGGWLAFWGCPVCQRRCRVLVNPLRSRWWPEQSQGVLSRHWSTTWRCTTCSRYRWPSQRRPGGHRGRGKPAQWYYAAHTAAVDRIQAVLEAPARLSLPRRIALERLEVARHTLAVHALSRCLPGAPAGPPQAAIEQAWQTIRDCRWALRQSSWHRGGRPRPGPEARAAMAKGCEKGGGGAAQTACRRIEGRG